MNIPNMITMARLFMTALVFVCLECFACYLADPSPELVSPSRPVASFLPWIAFWLFIAAAVTDFFDGYLARKWNLVTAFGRIADPFADKILITGTLITLLQFEAATVVLAHWYVVIVVAREFLVTAIRGVVEASGQAFGADKLGKWKMVSQCWTVGGLLLMVCGMEWIEGATIGGYWVSLVLTVVSGLNYVFKARHIFAKGSI